ncbi:MAG: hypothetical protein HY537_10075 [Deltaproteobacteria bacterium]|nr:hypothetical protein [Deltaproteobacteria bacterium]
MAPCPPNPVPVQTDLATLSKSLSPKSKAIFTLLLAGFLPLAGALPLFLWFGQKQWIDEHIHSGLEGAWVVIAFVLGFFLIRVKPRQPHYPWIVASFISSGIISGFHSLLPVSPAFFCSQGLSTFIGGSLIALVWLPSWASESVLKKLVPTLAAIASFSLGLWLYRHPYNLPVFQLPSPPLETAAFLNILGAAAYLTAATYFVHLYRKEARANYLIFASYCLLFGVSGILLGICVFWDAVCWYLHFLRFAACLVVLEVLFSMYQKMHKELLKSHLLLEKRVGERTLALRTAAEQLQKEIEERKQREDRLKFMTDELKRSYQEVEQFSYVASHDLKEPLRTIRTYLELLNRYTRNVLDSDSKEALDCALDCSHRMQTLIDSLLQYARVVHHEAPSKEVDLEEVFHITLSNLNAAIHDSKAIIVANDLPKVVGDRMQLIQLFQNLIGNALKFKGKQPPRIEVTCRRAAQLFEFCIKDNGIGFKQEEAVRIFKGFQRLHGRAEYSGSGIGLAICKKIANRHGGTIWAESEPANGAAFYFTLTAACDFGVGGGLETENVLTLPLGKQC